MPGDRTTYYVRILFNGKRLNRIIIDQHYRDRHSGYMTDETILVLVQKINGERMAPVSSQGEFDFFKVQPVYLYGNPYRLILITSKKDNFLGVINAFRVEAK